MSSHSFVFEDQAESSKSRRGPKLKMKLKETEAEKSERQWRKEQKRLRKETKRVYKANGISPLEGLATTPPRNAERDESITPPRKRRRSDDDFGSERRETYGYDPNASTRLADWDGDVWQPQPTGFEKLKAAARTELEEEELRQKMFDLMEDQEGPNPFVSGRYRSPPRARSPSPVIQPIPKRFQPGDVPDYSTMDDEEYAEAIRYGMWRRQNKDEVERLERLNKLQEEEDRKKARAKEAQEREEKRRIEVLTRERGAQDAKRTQQELSDYKAKWETLRTTAAADGKSEFPTLRLVDMPWPIFYGSSFHVFAPGMLSREKVEKFYTAMIPLTGDNPTTPTTAPEQDRTALKKILREAILAYHPDRFVGRYLAKVHEDEKDLVREAVIRTSQIINEIAADNK
ncbi:hypothetical protein NCC49_003023 [Naganishia albida]|nr:hypothetical protein NCC49_003023 [Naganishia albida]